MNGLINDTGSASIVQRRKKSGGAKVRLCGRVNETEYGLSHSIGNVFHLPNATDAAID